MPTNSERTPNFNDKKFEGRYCVSRITYDKIRTAPRSTAGKDFFKERVDAARVPSTTTNQKMRVAFRMLATGHSDDSCTEYSRLDERKKQNCPKQFC